MERIIFIGSKGLGFACLKEIFKLAPSRVKSVVTCDDSNDSRTKLNEFKHYCLENDLQIDILSKPSELNEIIFKLSPDICFVVGWYWMIGEDILNLSKYGFIGVHNSLLPRYRGGAPLIWAMLNEEPTVGISFFSLTPGMDDGPIWGQAAVKLLFSDYISDVLSKVERATLSTLNEIFPLIISHAIKSTNQDHENVTYGALRRPFDGNIDWNWPARRIYNFIRAQSHPYPGAYTFLEAQKIIIWKAKLFDHAYYGTPGQVAQISDGGVYVVCGDNNAIILESAEVCGIEDKANKFIKRLSGRFSNSSNESTVKC